MSENLQTITKDELARLPVRRYEGPVYLVESVDDLDRAMDDMRREHVVGIDTETQPTFYKGQSHPPSLVQIATADAVHLFQLKRRDFSKPLAEVLANPVIAKAGIGLSHDLLKLGNLFPFDPKNIVDVGTIAQQNGIQQSGVRNLAGLLLGFRITKGSRTSNWGRAHLTHNQILYAATDAWVCRELFLHFQKRGFSGKKLPPH